MDGVATYDNIKLYDSVDKKKNPDKVKALMSELIFDYIKDLIAKQEANATLRTVFNKLQAKEAELGYAEKLFDTLVCAKHNRYGKAVEQWFARYLDTLGIKGKDKVFHSFRHTFENKAIEMKLHTEHQNALGGWSNGGVGQRVYGGHLSIPNLYEEISKINYPIRRELQGLKEAYAKCYVRRFFEDMRK